MTQSDKGQFIQPSFGSERGIVMVEFRQMNGELQYRFRVHPRTEQWSAWTDVLPESPAKEQPGEQFAAPQAELWQAVERLLADYDNCGELSQHNLDFARRSLINHAERLERMKILLNRWHSSATQNDVPDLTVLINDTEREIF